MDKVNKLVLGSVLCIVAEYAFWFISLIGPIGLPPNTPALHVALRNDAIIAMIVAIVASLVLAMVVIVRYKVLGGVLFLVIANGFLLALFIAFPQ
ncbi:MAG TPA: hypothetical protein VKM55_06015 [Candidatus Lokiarchaeia archaeon]|nr:hypothetical protein [Candidatus Lokiarchaeia archaeon]